MTSYDLLLSLIPLGFILSAFAFVELCDWLVRLNDYANR